MDPIKKKILEHDLHLAIREISLIANNLDHLAGLMPEYKGGTDPIAAVLYRRSDAIHQHLLDLKRCIDETLKDGQE